MEQDPILQAAAEKNKTIREVSAEKNRREYSTTRAMGSMNKVNNQNSIRLCAMDCVKILYRDKMPDEKELQEKIWFYIKLMRQFDEASSDLTLDKILKDVPF